METKHKIYITAALFVIVDFTLISFFAYPTLKDIESISKDILSKRIEAASMDFQNRELDYFKKKYKEYGSNLEKIDQSFVDVKTPVDFIEFLEKIATDLAIDFDVNLNTTSKKEESDDKSAVTFQIFAKGNFMDILLFSEKLEKGPYLINIKNLSVKRVEKDILNGASDSEMVDANFSIETVSR